jgi:hypothetical protein
MSEHTTHERQNKIPPITDTERRRLAQVPPQPSLIPALASLSREVALCRRVGARRHEQYPVCSDIRQLRR